MLPVPHTAAQWGPTEPNRMVIILVVCPSSYLTAPIRLPNEMVSNIVRAIEMKMHMPWVLAMIVKKPLICGAIKWVTMVHPQVAAMIVEIGISVIRASPTGPRAMMVQVAIGKENGGAIIMAISLISVLMPCVIGGLDHTSSSASLTSPVQSHTVLSGTTFNNSD